MAIGNIARDMKGGGESSRDHTNNEKAGKIDSIEIFRIQKEVWYSQILTKIAADHGKHDPPAKH